MTTPEPIRTHPSPAKGIYTRNAHDYMRVVGTLTAAHLEWASRPTPKYATEDAPRDPREGQRVEGSVTISTNGYVQISSPEVEPDSARALEFEFRKALFDTRTLDPETGVRYQTKWFVALCRVEAERQAKRDGTMQIRKTEADLVHCDSSWALWSDGVITGTIGLPKWVHAISSLTRDACKLISAVWGSDSSTPAIGWALLTQIAEITNEETVDTGVARGHYAPACIERITARLVDGSSIIIYSYSEGYPEGYRFELHTLDSLAAAIRKGWKDARPDLEWLAHELAFAAAAATHGS